MVTLRGHNKVTERVIKPISVYVMDFLRAFKFSSDRLFHHKSVFKHSFPVDGNSLIARRGDLSGSTFSLHKRELLELIVLLIVMIMFFTKKPGNNVFSVTVFNDTIHGERIP